jgi:hypothetical protein
MLQEVTLSVLNGHIIPAPWYALYDLVGPGPAYPGYFTLLLCKSGSAEGAVKGERRSLRNTTMWRDLHVLSCSVRGVPVAIANTHLESPMVREREMHSERRVAQAASVRKDVLAGCCGAQNLCKCMVPAAGLAPASGPAAYGTSAKVATAPCPTCNQ